MDLARHTWDHPHHLKFSRNGKIKPYYGLTCITWIDPQSELFANLYDVQRSIQEGFEQSGVSHFYSFLEPASFHMTICDITSRPDPPKTEEANTIRAQVENAFSQGLSLDMVKTQVQGIGLQSTITALVRFRSETELQKVLLLEKVIKEAVQVDVRKFAGHITLAYCVAPPGDRLQEIWPILRGYQNYDFGEFHFSKFDLTCFTDMNTFNPLTTFDLETGEITKHPNQDKCMAL